jgi:hypothetical protein
MTEKDGPAALEQAIARYSDSVSILRQLGLLG